MKNGFFEPDFEEVSSFVVSDMPKPLSVADSLESPSEPRQSSNFVGLINQGATCYLNSLIQVMYMTPELRSAIYNLPLYESSLDIPSAWLPEGQKREILCALQELFVKLQLLDEKRFSTKNLTDSFHWGDSEIIVQHDAQELNRVLYDTIDRALQDTPYSNLIGKLYKGILINEIKCQNCQMSRQRTEDFYDIVLQVKDNPSITSSIEKMLMPDVLDGDNKLFCENCNQKCDSEKRTKFKQLPPILTLSLGRIQYDTKTMQRIKITDNYEFPLELDLSSYVNKESTYELLAVIIHGGIAHLGHYKAYIRDILKEGNWQPPSKQACEKKVIKIENNYSNDGGFQVKRRKRPKKNNNRKGKQYNNLETKQEKEEVKLQNIDFDFEEFPYGCNNKELLGNWFDFNDSNVNPIYSGKLLNQFGGSRETAYMLIYRDSSLSQRIKTPQIPDYWNLPIEVHNKNLADQRYKYQELKDVIEVRIQNFDLFDVNDGILLFKDSSRTTDQGLCINLKLNDNLTGFFEELRLKLNINKIDAIFVIEISPLYDKFVHLLRIIEPDNTKTIKEASIIHKSVFLIVPKNPNDERMIKCLNFVGEKCEPFAVTCDLFGESVEMVINKGWTVENLMLKIFDLTGIPIENQIIKIIRGYNDTKDIEPEDYNKTLLELKFYHTIKIEISINEKPSQTGMTSICVFDEFDNSNAIKHRVPLTWKIKDLIDDLKDLLKIEGPVRIRKVSDKNWAFTEHFNHKLKSIPEFEKGQLKISIERGESPSVGQIIIKVGLDSPENLLEILCKSTDHLSDIVKTICERYKIDINEHKIYRTDWNKQPTAAIKNYTQMISKSNIGDGDFLLIKSIDTVISSEMIKLFIHFTKTGYPSDCEFLEEISVAEEMTLIKLKELIFEMPKIFCENLSPYCLRIRERTDAFWFGKIFRENEKSLMYHGINFGSCLAVQILSNPDEFKQGSLQIYFSEWMNEFHKRGPPIEVFFDAGQSPSIDKLYQCVLDTLHPDYNIQDITLAIYKSNYFEWELIQDTRKKAERGNLMNHRSNKNSKGIYNLRKTPYFLKEGELIAIKYYDKNALSDEDFVKALNEERGEDMIMNFPDIEIKPRKNDKEKAIKIAEF